METKITKSWSLVAFAKNYNGCKIASLTNKETNETFKSLAFMQGDKVACFVGFSSNLGELNGAQLIAQKDNLQVVQLESGNYKLCKSGSSWQSVDL